MKAREPMDVKMELAGRIVADFHSAADAMQAARRFQPRSAAGRRSRRISRPWITARPARLRVPQMLAAIGLAPTRSEAERLMKAGAVEIDGVSATRSEVARRGGNAHNSRRKKVEEITVPE